MIRSIIPDLEYADLQVPLPGWSRIHGPAQSPTDIVRAAVDRLNRIAVDRFDFAAFRDESGLFIRATWEGQAIDFYLQDPDDAPMWQGVHFGADGKVVEFVPFPWRGDWCHGAPLLSPDGLFTAVVMALADYPGARGERD